MKKDDDIATRGLVLFSALIFTMFADSYAASVNGLSSESIRLLLPNATFVIGIIVYSVFTYKRGALAEDAEDGRFMRGIKRAFHRVTDRYFPPTDVSVPRFHASDIGYFKTQGKDSQRNGMHKKTKTDWSNVDE
jgi:hypothetical protein